MREPSLREIEKRTYMSYHQDGLIDIFLGIYVLLFALGILLKNLTDSSMWTVAPGIFPAIMLPIWISVKKRITMPRIGYVKFGTRRGGKLLAVIIGLMVAGLGAFMVFALASRSQAEGQGCRKRSLRSPWAPFGRLPRKLVKCLLGRPGPPSRTDC